MEAAQLEYIPITCQCEAVFNHYCPINFNTKTVRCCICGNTTTLPANYAQHIQPQKLPYEFMEANATLEFKTGAKPNGFRRSYIFVVDTNLEEKELAAIREELGGVVAGLPEHYNVGLITYGRNVKVYELSARINTNYCINGVKEYNVSSIMDLLGMLVKNDPNSQNSDITKRFIVPVSQYRSQIISRIRNLRADNHVYVHERSHSCFGQALNISVCMAEVSPIPSRIVYLVGNPCTVGPGMTIGTNFKEQMRSPQELSNGQNIKYFATAKNYYDSFTKRVVARSIVLDIFIFTLNETGFSEMSDLFITSGGFVVMHEEFRERIFKESFHKVGVRLGRYSKTSTARTRTTRSSATRRLWSWPTAPRKLPSTEHSGSAFPSTNPSPLCRARSSARAAPTAGTSAASTTTRPSPSSTRPRSQRPRNR
jgi:protein transport protein SEC23